MNVIDMICFTSIGIIWDWNEIFALHWDHFYNNKRSRSVFEPIQFAITFASLVSYPTYQFFMALHLSYYPLNEYILILLLLKLVGIKNQIPTFTKTLVELILYLVYQPYILYHPNQY